MSLTVEHRLVMPPVEDELQELRELIEQKRLEMRIQRSQKELAALMTKKRDRPPRPLTRGEYLLQLVTTAIGSFSAAFFAACQWGAPR